MLLIVNRGGQPLLDLRVFANGPFAISTLTNLFVVFALYGGLFLLPVYLQNLRGLSAFQAGLLLFPQALASMMSVVVGGRLLIRNTISPKMLHDLRRSAFNLVAEWIVPMRGKDNSVKS